jgi:regulator of sigma E protease
LAIIRGEWRVDCCSIKGRKKIHFPLVDITGEKPLQDILIYYLPSFLVVLGIVVFVHEFGHYIVAKMCGVKIESFSIGFGPEIFGFHDRSGTRWKVSLLPLGGYVKMFGDADPASQPSDKVYEMTAAERKMAFFHKSVGQRAAIVFAGPAINFIFTFLIFTVLFATQGQPYTQPLVGEVLPDSPAAAGGLQPGDRVLKINDVPVSRFEDVRREVSSSRAAELRFLVDRGGAEVEKNIVPRITEITDRFGTVHKVNQIGVKAEAGKVEYRHLQPAEAAGVAVTEMSNMVSSTLSAIGQIIAGTRGTEELGGPLRIAEMSGKVGKEGIVPLIWFMGVISLSLGLFNLFPIPLLDGGHLFFYAIEALKGKPVNDRIMEAFSRVGFFLIIGMMIFFTWNDLVQLRVVSYVRGLFS